MTDAAQNIVDQVLEEVQNTPGVGVDNPSEVANQALQDTLVASVIPEEYWPEIVSWVSETGLDTVYLDSGTKYYLILKFNRAAGELEIEWN